MKFEERYGVKVDVRLPRQDKIFFYEHWEQWLSGKAVNIGRRIGKRNLETRYEHFLIGRNAGFPPDPFKPLILYAKNVDPEKVMAARRKKLAPGDEYPEIKSATLIPDFQQITGLCPSNYFLSVERPYINDDGRVPVPSIMGVYDRHGTGEWVELEEDVLDQLRLPTSQDDLVLESGIFVREIFDFDNGYRIELAI